MSEFNATEQRVHHSRAMLNAAVANIARNAHCAIQHKGQLLACSSYYWTTPLHKDGISSLAGRMQTGVYAYDWMPFFRGFLRIPRFTSRLRARCMAGIQIADRRLIRPRIKVDVGSGDVDIGAEREIASTDLTVNGSNLATATLAEGHGLRLGDWIWTTGFSANVSAAAPVPIIAATETAIYFALVSSAGSKGAGTIVAPGEYYFDTAANADDGRVIGPSHASPETNVYHDLGAFPVLFEASVDLADVDTSSASVVADVRVDARVRWYEAGSLTAPTYIQGAAPHVPCLVMIYAEADVEDLDPSPLELSAGEAISASLFGRLNDLVRAASTREITHLSIHCGGNAWDDYPADSDGAGAGGGVGVEVRPDFAPSSYVLDTDLYFDLTADLTFAFSCVLAGTGTWTVTLYVEGGYSASVPGITATSTVELSATITGIAPGWRRAYVQATRTSGTGSLTMRSIRLTESASLGVPEDD